jgi:hypothetical protein
MTQAQSQSQSQPPTRTEEHLKREDRTHGFYSPIPLSMKEMRLRLGDAGSHREHA